MVLRGAGSRRAWLLAGAVLLFFVWRMLAHRAPLTLASSDLYSYHYLADQFVFGELARGTLPSWNPYQLCGIPIIAALEVGAFYPPYLVSHLLLPTHFAMAASALFHLLLVAFATAALGRRFGLGHDASLLAAILFTLRASFPGFAVSPNMFAAAAWLPVGALGVLDLVERPGPRAVVLLAMATAASFLGGHPQITLYVIYAWGTLLVAWLLAVRPAPRRWLGSAALFGAALGLGALVALVQLLPTSELTRVGTRAATGLTVSEMLPRGPFTAALQQLLGHPITGGRASFGIVGLALAAASLFGGHRALGLWALALGVASGIAALAIVTPFFRLYQGLPFVGWFRFPNRLTLLTDFAFAFLAAAGLDALLRGHPPGTRRARTTLLLGLLPVGVLAALYWRQEGPGLVAAAGATAVVLAVTFWPRRAALPAATGLAIALLALVETLSRPPLPASFPYTPGRAARFQAYDRAWATLRAHVGHDRVWLVGTPFDPAIAPKQATRARLRAIDDYAPLNLRRQAEYFTFLTEAAPIRTRLPLTFSGFLPTLDSPPGVPPPSTRRRLLDLAALRYLVTDEALAERPDLRQFLVEAGFVPAGLDTGRLAVFENPHALPRAFTVYRVLPAPSPAALLARLADPAFDPLATSFVAGDPGFVAAADAPARGGPASFLRDDRQVVELDVTLAAPGLVVLADSYFPGWQATVDGQPAPILATNHLFRGVPVPQGRHRVRFAYRPTTLWVGAAGTLAGLLLLAGLAAWRRRAAVRA